MGRHSKKHRWSEDPTDVEDLAVPVYPFHSRVLVVVVASRNASRSSRELEQQDLFSQN